MARCSSGSAREALKCSASHASPLSASSRSATCRPRRSIRGRARVASGSSAVAATLAGTARSATLACSRVRVAASMRWCAPGRSAFFCLVVAGPATTKQKNADRPGAHQRIEAATRTREQARVALRAVPAKVAATALDPDATRARPRIERRGLQVVLRLLAYNGEAWLAEHFNAYLADPDEHRAILRHLLHLGGRVDYRPVGITVTLDRPDSPRVAHAARAPAGTATPRTARTRPPDHH